MGQIIKPFYDKSYLEYNFGKFDKWCVYFISKDGKRYAPKDKEYFNALKKLSKKYTTNKVYDDFCFLYDKTKDYVEDDVLEFIDGISKNYKEDSYKVNVIFSILYMAMIAEERKRNAILGKRIKRLGIYNLLVKNESVDYSTNFMKNKPWRYLDSLCKEAGF